jgi:hypothetical protein
MKHPEGLVVDDLGAFIEAGSRLRDVDPEKFRRLLALARAMVSLHDREVESADVYASRRAEIASGRPKAIA